MLLHNCLPLKKLDNISCNFGIRVEPPTNTISSILSFDIFASFNTFSTGDKHLRNKSIFISSNLALVKVLVKSTPSYKASISMNACVDVDNVLFALSHAVLNLLNDLLLSLTSFLNFLLNSFLK